MKDDVFYIPAWSENFENNRTRELKVLSWVPLPNKHDSDGYTELMDHPNGPAHYAAWVTIVQVASKCDPRGTLLRGGSRPHSTATLSRITRVPVEVYEEAIPRLESIGWLSRKSLTTNDVASIPQVGATKSQAGAEIPQEGALNGREGKEGNGKEKKRCAASAKTYSNEFEEAWIAFSKTHRGGKSKPDAWKAWQRALERIRGRPGVEDPSAWLTSRIKTFAASADGHSEYSPLLSSFLNKDRFDESDDVWNRTNGHHLPNRAVLREQANANAFATLYEAAGITPGSEDFSPSDRPSLAAPLCDEEHR